MIPESIDIYAQLFIEIFSPWLEKFYQHSGLQIVNQVDLFDHLRAVCEQIVQILC
jgi:hypothetical protein